MAPAKMSIISVQVQLATWRSRGEIKWDSFRCVGAFIIAAFILSSFGVEVRAEDADAFDREVETERIFGFTEGASIRLEGEKEFAFETDARIGKRDGRYWVSETKAQFEFTPNQYIALEFGPFVSTYRIRDVSGVENQSQFAFGGLFGEIKYMVLDRGPSSPLAVTLSAEPEWRRSDETSGMHVNNFALGLKLNADFELIKNRLYLGANLLYEPEATHDPNHVGAGWEKESRSGVSAAFTYRIVPAVFVGAEVWYLRHYDGTWFNTYTGNAFYVGPTIYVQLGPKVYVSAAWNTQVRGHDVDNPCAPLNLVDFSHNRGKLRLAVEF